MTFPISASGFEGPRGLNLGAKVWDRSLQTSTKQAPDRVLRTKSLGFSVQGFRFKIPLGV